MLWRWYAFDGFGKFANKCSRKRVLLVALIDHIWIVAYSLVDLIKCGIKVVRDSVEQSLICYEIDTGHLSQSKVLICHLHSLTLIPKNNLSISDYRQSNQLIYWVWYQLLIIILDQDSVVDFIPLALPFSFFFAWGTQLRIPY